MTSFTTSRERYYLVDGLRGIAAIAVMIRHISQHTYTPLFANGRIAADIFIFAGGFMTAYAYHNKLCGNLSLKGFFLSRMARLYPLFIFGWLLGIVNLFLKVNYHQTDFTYLSSALSALHNLVWLPYFSNNSVDIVIEKTIGAVFPGNDPAWTLALIFWSSLIYAYFITRHKRIAIFVIMTLGAVALFLFVKINYIAGPGWGSGISFFGGIARTLFCFFGGIILHLYWRQIKPFIPTINNGHIVLPLAILLLLAMPNFPGYYMLWLFMVYTVVPFLVAVTIAAPVASQTIKNICTALGKLSYPIYCIHYPVFSIYSTTKPNENLNAIEISILVIGTLILGHLLVRYYDDPISAWIKRKGIR